MEMPLASAGQTGYFPPMAISAKVQRIMHEVETLNDEERDELIQALSPVVGESVTDEWRQEIRRRADEIDAGEVQLMDEAEFLRKLRAI